MSDDVREKLQQAGDQYKAVRVSYEAAGEHLRPIVVEALRAGIRQKDVVDLSGYTREFVRKLARANGIEGAPGPQPRG